MHYMLLVELPPEAGQTESSLDLMHTAMEPFFSDCYGEEPECNHKAHRWDWWQLGGRYRDALLAREGAWQLHGEPGVPEAHAIRNGEAVLTITGCDAARKADIDWEGMAARRNTEAHKAWAEAQEKDPVIRDLAYGIKPDDTEESYVARVTDRFATFAILTADGQWTERETFIYNEATEQGRFDAVPDWPQRWDELVAAMPPDAVLAIVDYHN